MNSVTTSSIAANAVASLNNASLAFRKLARAGILELQSTREGWRWGWTREAKNAWRYGAYRGVLKDIEAYRGTYSDAAVDRLYRQEERKSWHEYDSAEGIISPMDMVRRGIQTLDDLEEWGTGEASEVYPGWAEETLAEMETEISRSEI